MTVIDLIGVALSALALAATLTFVIMYQLGSSWRRSLIGRVIMYRAASMALILLYVLVARVFVSFGLPDDTRRVIGLGVFAVLVWAEIRMVFVLRYAQQGRITVSHPNYEPVRAWVRQLRKRRTERRNG